MSVFRELIGGCSHAVYRSCFTAATIIRTSKSFNEKPWKVLSSALNTYCFSLSAILRPMLLVWQPTSGNIVAEVQVWQALVPIPIVWFLHHVDASVAYSHKARSKYTILMINNGILHTKTVWPSIETPFCTISLENKLLQDVVMLWPTLAALILAAWENQCWRGTSNSRLS